MTKSDWFTVEKINEATFVISEYRHPEETHCYLLCGKERALLIDSGLGIGNIYEEVLVITDKPVTVVATHAHWDHIGGHKHFNEILAHRDEADWLCGEFPLPISLIRKMLEDGSDLPRDFNAEKYELFCGSPDKLLDDGDVIELGERSIRVIHTPGHSPGHMCFFDETSGFMFTGDLVYRGILYANYRSTDPKVYLNSLKKISSYRTARVFPAHHSLDITPEIILRMAEALQGLENRSQLCHGSGKFDFGDWSIFL